MTTRTLPLITLAALAALATACGSSDGPRDAASGADRGTAQADARDTRDTRYADQDRDGKVTREEAQADPYLAASFDRYDGDKNEALDRAEFARLEADAIGTSASDDGARGERHQLRPRNEFPRPMQ